MEISFSATKDSLTVVIDGEPTTVRKGAPNYLKLRVALLEEDWAAVPGLVTIRKAISTWADGAFRVQGEQIQYQEKPVPESIGKRILAMITANEDPGPLLRFYERLKRNPSRRSVENLFPFLGHAGIPIEPEGTFLTYKSVRPDCRDHHSGTVDYTPSRDGAPNRVVTVERNEVSDDPRTACHFGLHVGALRYARNFGQGGKILIIRVDPEDVVCVPYDSSSEKMRVCKLEVVGFWSGQEMPSTTYSTDDRLDPETIDEEEEEEEEEDAWGDEADAAEDTYDGEEEDEEEDEYADEFVMPTPKPELKEKRAKSRGFMVTDEHIRYFDSLDQMDGIALEEQPLHNRAGLDLRKYAFYRVKVVGASKIPGGKSALIRNILEVRDGDGFKKTT